ncbi:MAG: restriction endonuclease subunit S [Bacteroidetes bacterium]|nr:restriction endonuclease subunit S [Bacteroidota bacterium]
MKKIIDSNYLFRVLQSKIVNHHFAIAAKGVTRCRLSYDDISSVVIPFPPSIEEQKSTAQIIETESTKVTHFIQTKNALLNCSKSKGKALLLTP